MQKICASFRDPHSFEGILRLQAIRLEKNSYHPMKDNRFPYKNGRSVSGANAASEAAFWGQNAASSRLKRSCIFIEAALQEMFPQKLCRYPTHFSIIF